MSEAYFVRHGAATYARLIPMARLTFTVVRVAQGLMADPYGVHYGYGLSGELGVSNGVLYPMLLRWARAELLTSDWEQSPEDGTLGHPPRRLYKLTPAGRKHFAALLRRAADDRRFTPLFM